MRIGSTTDWTWGEQELTVYWVYEESEYGDGSICWEFITLDAVDSSGKEVVLTLEAMVQFKEYLENTGELS